MSKPKPLQANTVMRYAVDSGAVGSLEYIDGMSKHWPPLPHEGDVLTVPFLVDPKTRQPVPVLVMRIVEMLHMDPPTIAIVVGRRH